MPLIDFDWLIDWLILIDFDWLIDWLTDWLIDWFWLIDWLISFDWLIDWLIFVNQGGRLGMGRVRGWAGDTQRVQIAPLQYARGWATAGVKVEVKRMASEDWRGFRVNANKYKNKKINRRINRSGVLMITLSTLWLCLCMAQFVFIVKLCLF